MTPERHEQIASLFYRAVTMAPSERAGFLDTACAGLAAVAGRITLKHVPRPTLLSTVISPLKLVTMRLQMDSPDRFPRRAPWW